MKQTKEAIQNDSLLIDVSRELYDFLTHDAGIPLVRAFEDLTEKEMAVFRVRARLMVDKITKGWE